MKKLKDSLCIICYEEKVLTCLEKCQHEFCRDCLFLWKEKNGRCPLCRIDMKNFNLIVTRNNAKVYTAKIFKIIYDFFEDQDEFSIPEIINLYEKIHEYSYFLYRNEKLRDVILHYNKKILKVIEQNNVMKVHPQKSKLRKLLQKSYELSQIYSGG